MSRQSPAHPRRQRTEISAKLCERLRARGLRRRPRAVRARGAVEAEAQRQRLHHEAPVQDPPRVTRQRQHDLKMWTETSTRRFERLN